MTATRRTRRSLAVLAAVLLGSAFAAPAASAAVAPAGEPLAAGAPAALSSGQLTVTKVVGGFSTPLGVTHAGDGSGRLFVVEQGGRVRIVSGRKITGTFLDVGSRITAGGERGLLGLAFHPDFATNGFVFVYFTRPGGDIVVNRMTANAARTSASLTTEQPVLVIEHSQHSNHNGGAMAFGPDGYLYIGTGDGGGSGDPLANGQDITAELLGKILRIDPDLDGNGGYTIPADNPFVGKTGDDEIWAFGLRNPWRISFDRTTGNLFIADVGQSRREEVNRELASDVGGRNYGWNVMEGSLCYPSGASCSFGTLPVAEYSHAFGCSITGGYVYRGAHRDLQGQYVFGDYCSGRMWTMSAGGSAINMRRDTSLNISSFGENEAGELYLTDLGSGSLYRVIAPEFSDIATSSFIDHIHWLFYEGITGGCGSGKFCPKASVTRVQMAQFLVRAFGYPTTPTNYFSDDEGITGETSIDALREARITAGCGGTRFCPTRPVTRAQMAIFLVKAIEKADGVPMTAPSRDYFDDDDGKTGESSINRLAEAGLTGGCGTRMYCPTQSVTREQMAAFLKRVLTR